MRMFLASSQDTVYLRADHCCYLSRPSRVEMHGDRDQLCRFKSSFIEDVFSRKESPLQAVFPVFIRFGVFNTSTLVHIHTSHVSRVVYIANLTVRFCCYSLQTLPCKYFPAKSQRQRDPLVRINLQCH